MFQNTDNFNFLHKLDIFSKGCCVGQKIGLPPGECSVLPSQLKTVCNHQSREV